MQLDLNSEKARLLRRDAEWAAAASEGRDVDLILSYWTDDAVVYAPGLPAIAGKKALREYVEGSMKIPGFRISWTTTDVMLSDDATLAYMFSRNTVQMNAADGTPATTEGRAVTVWCRGSNGEWRCAVDIWNA